MTELRNILVGAKDGVTAVDLEKDIKTWFLKRGYNCVTEPFHFSGSVEVIALEHPIVSYIKEAEEGKFAKVEFIDADNRTFYALKNVTLSASPDLPNLSNLQLAKLKTREERNSAILTAIEPHEKSIKEWLGKHGHQCETAILYSARTISITCSEEAATALEKAISNKQFPDITRLIRDVPRQVTNDDSSRAI